MGTLQRLCAFLAVQSLLMVGEIIFKAPLGGAEAGGDEAENLLGTFDNVELVVEGQPGRGPGTLTATERRVAWTPHPGSVGEAAGSLEFDYYALAMHSISRDPASFPRPCIYCHLDTE